MTTMIRYLSRLAEMTMPGEKANDAIAEPGTLPPDGLGALTWRPLSAEDLDLWQDLVFRIQDHDEERERQTRGDLRDILESPRADVSESSALGLDATGAARTWARNFTRRGQDGGVLVHMTGGVDPLWRRRGIGRGLLQWQCARAAQIAGQLRSEAEARGDSVPRIQMGRFVEEQVSGSNALFLAADFAPTRWFSEMRRTLLGHEGAGGTELPEKLRLRPYTSDVSGRCAVAFNAAFAGHWGTPTHTPESWVADVESDDAFRAELSFVIVDGAAESEPVVAFVINAEYEEDWPAQGYTEGYTEYVAVVPAHRGQGLAALLLQLTAEHCVTRKHRYATLAVDADNPSSAKALYEKQGYERHHVTIYYAREA